MCISSATLDTVSQPFISFNKFKCFVQYLIFIFFLCCRYLHRLCIEKKNAYIYGFIDPVAIQSVGNKAGEVQTYLIETFQNGGKEVYLAPYLHQ